MKLTPKTRLALGTNYVPPVGTFLSGALVAPLYGAGWVGPFFMDELDGFPEYEQSIVRGYRSLNYNEVTLGCAYAMPGYRVGSTGYTYPATNWIAEPDKAIAFLKRQAQWANITFVLMPDCAPYFDGRTWDWGAIDRDFLPLWKRIAAEVPQIKRFQTYWELIVSLRDNERICERVHSVWGSQVEILYHNPVGHLSPGPSSVDEYDCWGNFVHAGGTGMRLQAGPPGSRPDALEAMLYDLQDMERRLSGVPKDLNDGKGNINPWGNRPPLITVLGGVPSLWYGEGCSYDEINAGLPHSVAQGWGRAAKQTVPRIAGSLDGY